MEQEVAASLQTSGQISGETVIPRHKYYRLHTVAVATYTLYSSEKPNLGLLNKVSVYILHLYSLQMFILCTVHICTYTVYTNIKVLADFAACD